MKYIGNGKLIMGKYGDFLDCSICLSDLDRNADIVTAKNGKKYINFLVSERKEKGKFGDTHSIKLKSKPQPSFDDDVIF